MAERITEDRLKQLTALSGLDRAQLLDRVIRQERRIKDLEGALKAQAAHEDHVASCSLCKAGWECQEGANLSLAALTLRVMALGEGVNPGAER